MRGAAQAGSGRASLSAPLPTCSSHLGSSRWVSWGGTPGCLCGLTLLQGFCCLSPPTPMSHYAIIQFNTLKCFPEQMESGGHPRSQICAVGVGGWFAAVARCRHRPSGQCGTCENPTRPLRLTGPLTHESGVRSQHDDSQRTEFFSLAGSQRERQPGWEPGCWTAGSSSLYVHPCASSSTGEVATEVRLPWRPVAKRNKRS